MEHKLEIVGIAKRREHLSIPDALAKAGQMGLRVLTNKEVDELLQDEKTATRYREYFPCLTATHVAFDGNSGQVTENGITAKVNMPQDDGWYVADAEFGLPIGEKSGPKNPNARHLSRLQDRGFFAVRGWNHVDSEFIPYHDWRDVTLHNCDTNLGALGTPIQKSVKSKTRMERALPKTRSPKR